MNPTPLTQSKTALMVVMLFALRAITSKFPRIKEALDEIGVDNALVAAGTVFLWLRGVTSGGVSLFGRKIG